MIHLKTLFTSLCIFIFFLSSFTAEAQLKSKVIAEHRDNTVEEFCIIESYTFYSTLIFSPSWTSISEEGGSTTNSLVTDEPPCDLHIGVSILELGDALIITVPMTDLVDESSSDGDYFYYFEFNIPVSDIEIDQLCHDGMESFTFVIDLYCKNADGSFTDVDPSSDVFSSFFDLPPNSDDLSEQLSGELCCGDSEEDDSGGENGDGDGPLGGNLISNSVGGQELFVGDDYKNSINKTEIIIDDNTLKIENRNSSATTTQYKIVNISGQILCSGTIDSGNKAYQINTNFLNHGLYIFTYLENGEIKSFKFVR